MTGADFSIYVMVDLWLDTLAGLCCNDPPLSLELSRSFAVPVRSFGAISGRLDGTRPALPFIVFAEEPLNDRAERGKGVIITRPCECLL